jgi:hypothetical protein
MRGDIIPATDDEQPNPRRYRATLTLKELDGTGNVVLEGFTLTASGK